MGFYDLRWVVHGTQGSSGASTSAPLQVFLTHADVADLHFGTFNILDEETLCAGSIATATFTCLNGGELAASDAVADLYSASNASMTADLQYVTSFALGTIHGGWPNTSFTRTFTFPTYSGARYFALRASPHDVPYKHTPWGMRDKVAQNPDVKFGSSPWVWISPPPSPPQAAPTVPADSIVQFRYWYENRGTWPTADTTAVQLEMKAKNGSWKSVPGATWNVGAIPCRSGLIESPVVQANVTGDLANEDDYGKKRALRLRFINTGEPTSLTNNKSKSKDILVVAPPVTIDGPTRVTAGTTVTLATVGGATGSTYAWEIVSGSSAGSLVGPDGHAAASTGSDQATLATWQSFDGMDLLIKLAYTSPTGALVELGHNLTVTPLPAIEVRYKAFIKCQALEGPPFSDYTLGDDRDFGYDDASSRIRQVESITLAGIVPGMGETAQFQTREYTNCVQGSGPTWCDTYCWSLTPESMLECGPELGYSNPTAYWDSAQVAGYPTLNFSTEVGPGCLFLTAHIDYLVRVFLRQDTDPVTQLKSPIRFSVFVWHDGFPWHELYVNGFFIKVHDPCLDEESVYELLTDYDHTFHYPEQLVPGTLEWAVVPGLGF